MMNRFLVETIERMREKERREGMSGLYAHTVYKVKKIHKYTVERLLLLLLGDFFFNGISVMLAAIAMIGARMRGRN